MKRTPSASVASVLSGDTKWTVEHADCLALLRSLPDACVDSIVTDPPSGIGFMNKKWDSNKGGKDLPEGLGPWLAGLVDGEGNFDIHKQKRKSGDYYYCRFEISLRADDGGMLQMLKRLFGGKVYYGKAGPGLNEKARWECVSRAECLKLVQLFDRFPLQSKKARDFAIWREALAVSNAHAGTNRADLMDPFWQQLRSTRPFAGSVTSPTEFVEMDNSNQWIAWLTKIMKEALRVLKPGGHALVWALPRTSHWTATAVEDAGFEIRDVLTHLFGQGMPKNQDASKAIDLKNGDKAKRPIVGSYMAGGNAGTSTAEKSGTYAVGAKNSEAVELKRTIGATEQSRAWDGWGTALRPAAENWILARKPLIGILADNLTEHGTGAINIDANRIPRNYDAEPDRPESWRKSGHSAKPDAEKIAAPPGVGIDLHPGGGWPANVVFSHDVECGSECANGCPVALLGEQSGEMTPNGTARRVNAASGYRFSPETTGDRVAQLVPNDTGAASRFFNVLRAEPIDAEPFFYQAKPSTAEREAGCDAFALKSATELVEREEGSVGIKNGRAGAGRSAEEGRHNNHPTLKSIALMRLLTRAVTRKGGVCLDLFTGSGTTGCACVIEGFRFIGAELNDSVQEPFASIARARITHVSGGSYVPREELRAQKLPSQTNLFEVSA